MAKTARLTNLELDEISLVDAGANPHAAIVLAKRKAQKVGKAEGVTYGAEISLNAMIEEIGCALREKFGGNAGEEDYWLYVRDVFESTVVFSQGGETWRADYTATQADGEIEIQLGDRVSVKMLYEDAPEKLGSSVDDASASAMKGANEMAAENQTVELSSELVKVKELGGTVVELQKRLDAMENENKITKAALEAEQKRADELAKAAKVEKDLRLLGEFEVVAKAKLGNLSGSDKDKAVLLKSMSENLPEEEYKKALELMEAGSVAMAKHFQPVGASGAIGEATAQGKMQTMAKALATEKGITYSKALIEVGKANPQLYADYQQERRAQ
jgi:hypothetical protein